jgi:hypothetical protein
VGDVLVAQRVDDLSSLSYALDQTRASQNAKLLRHVWLGQSRGGHDLMYEHRLTGEEVNDRHSYG